VCVWCPHCFRVKYASPVVQTPLMLPSGPSPLCQCGAVLFIGVQEREGAGWHGMAWNGRIYPTHPPPLTHPHGEYTTPGSTLLATASRKAAHLHTATAAQRMASGPPLHRVRARGCGCLEGSVVSTPGRWSDGRASKGPGRRPQNEAAPGRASVGFTVASERKKCDCTSAGLVAHPKLLAGVERGRDGIGWHGMGGSTPHNPLHSLTHTAST
jgi:hypothetical protein